MDEIKIPEEVHKVCAQIADYAMGLRNVLNEIMGDTPESLVCTLTLEKIFDLADRYV